MSENVNEVAVRMSCICHILTPCTEPLFPTCGEHTLTTSGFLQVLPAECLQALSGWNTGSLISQHNSVCIPCLIIHLCCLSDYQYIAGQFNLETT